MANKEKVRPHFDESDQIEKDNDSHLILHNDDFNTFEYVIDCLIEICEHESHQAEQCALITHHKGKCEVKTGVFDKLSHLKSQLNSKGLTVSID